MNIKKHVMKKVFTLALTLLTVSTALSHEGVNPTSGSGTMQVRMTNSESSPFGLILDIVNVEVYSDKNGWITLNDYQQSISSLSFTGGEQSLLANADIPFGIYSKLRLTFGSSNSIISDVHNISANDLTFETRQIEIPILQHVGEHNPGKIYIHFDLTTSVSVLDETYVLKPVMEEISDPASKSSLPDINVLSSTY